jgi:hypothetical protein
VRTEIDMHAIVPTPLKWLFRRNGPTSFGSTSSHDVMLSRLVRIRHKVVWLGSRSAVSTAVHSWAETQRGWKVKTSQTHRDTLPKEHSMATQTRRTTRRSARFFTATVKAAMVTACCGLVLLSAVAAHAGAYSNGMPYNGLPFNGLPFNGLPFNGLPFNGLPFNGLPFNGAGLNGTPLNGMPYNGIPMQGMPMNGTPLNGLPANEGSLPTVQSESLPWSTVSQQGVGKHQPPYCKGPLCRL